MDDLRMRLTTLLREEFRGADVELEQADPSESVGGFIVWSGFAGQEQIDRQERLWTSIRSKLPRADQTHVTLIMTLTPEEKEALSRN